MEYNNRENIIAVIQAGGMGTRVLELTHDELPKPMLLLNGRPMLLWQIDVVKRYGIKRIIIIIGHLGEKIRDYFGNGERYGVHISYIEEREPLGSAGSLFYVRDYPADKYLFIFGDVMFDMDISRLLNFHNTKSAQITLVAHPNAHPDDSDLLKTDLNDCVTEIIGKKNTRNGWFQNFVNAGLYVVQEDVLKYIQILEKYDWEKDIVANLLPSGKIFAYRTSEYIKDAGTPERFKKCEEEQIQGKWKRKNLENKQRCIFIDRDGTLNKFAGLISKPEQLVLEDGAEEAVKLINSSEYLSILVTNQSVVARGLCTEEDVRIIHKKLDTLLGRSAAYLDDIIYCPHHPDKGYPEENPEYKIDCQCRKPKTGMINIMADKYNIDLSKSYIIGDSTTDIQTGINAGLHTVLVHTGEAGKDGKYTVSSEMEAENILMAVKAIIDRKN